MQSEALTIGYVISSKFYNSKIENNIKEVRISTLKKIVEFGLGGNLELKINLN